MQISDTNGHQQAQKFALFALGFRVFFLGAGWYAVISVALWMLILVFGVAVEPVMAPLTWHAHEMLYGYTMAVIAGFLLTAVQNWTGRPTPSGFSLAAVFSLWLLARIMPYVPLYYAVHWMALFDMLFGLGLLAAVAVPVIQAHAWRQLAVIGKIALLLAGNACFYIGLFGWWQEGIRFGLYFGLYTIIALILTMGRRVIPFFTERGVGYEVALANRRWLDISSVVVFIIFFICDLFINARQLAAVCALILFLLHGIRLYGWHTPGIWRKPLLWSLFAGYSFIIIGFLLYAASVYLGTSAFAATHAFAYGGIGMLTLSMMSRVSLGHTGRNVHQAPRLLSIFLILLVAGTLIRVFPVLFDPAHYRFYLLISQILWMLSFAGFIRIYTPILIQPRIDGKPG